MNSTLNLIHVFYRPPTEWQRWGHLGTPFPRHVQTCLTWTSPFTIQVTPAPCLFPMYGWQTDGSRSTRILSCRNFHLLTKLREGNVFTGGRGRYLGSQVSAERVGILGLYVCIPTPTDTDTYRASSSYFFLFFPIFLSILLFFLFFSNFLLFFLFFSHFTYNKQIFVRDLNILSLFKYVAYRVH